MLTVVLYLDTLEVLIRCRLDLGVEMGQQGMLVILGTRRWKVHSLLCCAHWRPLERCSKVFSFLSCSSHTVPHIRTWLVSTVLTVSIYCVGATRRKWRKWSKRGVLLPWCTCKAHFPGIWNIFLPDLQSQSLAAFPVLGPLLSLGLSLLSWHFSLPVDSCLNLENAVGRPGSGHPRAVAS